ncbi:hypothetical protein B0H17DRAFT_1123514 [Mycena rosella]|uniref:Fungal-type protein kinase domain-containing protein n=1 Tax=Mycena rosella TaxID=1033263 RepID=A0AAD7H2E2_MYCRO|nr:hypothetical protein B0H17DRAFT_1123514 [Mycena rosella]
MAIDLLVPNPLTHRYRHDLESLFYVILWIITSYHDGKRVDKPPLREWKYLGMQRLQERKLAFLAQLLPLATANFTLIHQNWVVPFLVAIPAYAASAPPFDYETLGGHVSFDKFAEIMEQEF